MDVDATALEGSAADPFGHSEAPLEGQVLEGEGMEGQFLVRARVWRARSWRARLWRARLWRARVWRAKVWRARVWKQPVQWSRWTENNFAGSDAWAHSSVCQTVRLQQLHMPNSGVQ